MVAEALLDGLATVVVRDDGAEPRRGSGLVGLADRVEALGGRLHIESPWGKARSSPPTFRVRQR